MIKRLALLLTLLAANALAAESYSFDMPKEGLRIVIPDMPQMEMRAHPNASQQAHARYMGSDDKGLTISILTPTCDPGMGPQECASFTADSLVKRYGLDAKAVKGWKNDANTFVVVFPVRVESAIQLKAYFLSGYGGTHCLEIHLSKTMAMRDKETVVAAMTEWYQQFRTARIGKLN